MKPTSLFFAAALAVCQLVAAAPMPKVRTSNFLLRTLSIDHHFIRADRQKYICIGGLDPASMAMTARTMPILVPAKIWNRNT
jgi:hypothetical protein